MCRRFSRQIVQEIRRHTDVFQEFIVQDDGWRCGADGRQGVFRGGLKSICMNIDSELRKELLNKELSSNKLAWLERATTSSNVVEL